MAQRVEHETTYEAYPGTTLLGSELSSEVQTAFDTVIDETIRQNELQWEDRAGFMAANPILTKLVEGMVPECESEIDGCPASCLMMVEVEAVEGRASSAEITFTCPKVSEPKKKDADAREATCLANHKAAREAFETGVVEKAAAIKKEQLTVTRSQTASRNAESRLRSLV